MTFPGFLRAHLARIHLGWRFWLSSRRTAPVVAGAGWLGGPVQGTGGWTGRFPALLAAAARQFPVTRPSGAGGFLARGNPEIASSLFCLNAPCGAGCFLTLTWHMLWLPRRTSLNAPSGAGCFLTPASGNGVVAPLPEVGAPPAPQAPRGTGRHGPYLTTFRRPDAKRHRHPLGRLQPPVSNDVKPKDRRSHP